MTLPIPNGERTFLDRNGQPISGGLVYSYVPGTTNPSPTYADEGLSVQNPNPITLDQAGRCVMWGAGLFRQVVQDMFGNLQWDQETGFQINSQDFPPDLTIPGNVTVGGNFTVDGYTNLTGGANVTGGLTADNINATNLTVNGTTNLNGTTNITGTFNMPEDIFVRNIGPYPGITLPNFTAGANFQANPNVGPGDAIQAFGNIDIFQPGRYLRIQGSGEATLALTDLQSGVSWGITVSGQSPGVAMINFGFVDGQAAQIKNLMSMDIAGDTEIAGNLQVDLNLTVIGTINGASAADFSALAGLADRMTALESSVSAMSARLGGGN